MAKYKLGPKASSFYDATQPKDENKSLSVGEVKELHATPTVNTWLRNGGLVIATSEDEQDAEQAAGANQKAIATAAASAPKSEKANKKAKEILDAAKQKHQEATVVLEQANETAAANDTKAAELTKKEEELAKREKALNEKEQAQGDPGKNTGNGGK